MATTTNAHLNPEVLRWARESMGYTQKDAADVIKDFTWRVEAAESGDDLLTWRQAEKLADFYDRPLADLFLPEPPDEEPQEAQFRRLPGAPELPWPPAMRKLARKVRGRQQAAAELFELLDEKPPWTEQSSWPRETAPSRMAAEVRDRLGVSLAQQHAWLDPKGYTPLRAWIDAAESLGILVMGDGSLTVAEMRGFASVHPAVPAIVVNTKDDPRARAYTVIHELAHLIDPSASERWCNEFAGEVIMPAKPLAAVFATTIGDTLARATAVALRFGVTPAAAAVRLKRAKVLPETQAEDLINLLASRDAQPRRQGGNHYLNKIAWLGPSFIRLVFEAVDEQVVTLSSAATMLEEKVNHFGQLREAVDGRSEPA